MVFDGAESMCGLCGSRDLRPTRAGLERCMDCGLAGAYPLPAPRDLKKLYTREYYEAWGGGGGEDRAVKAMKQATFARRLDPLMPLRQGARILDVGCATGFFLDLIEARGGEAHGVEINPYAARVAEARFPGRIKEGTLAEAAYPDGYFHTVFMSDLIEHVPRPGDLLDETHRILEPGGRLVVCTPDFGGLSARLLGKRWFHRKKEHILYFSRPPLRAALSRAGFLDIRTKPGVKCMTIHYLASQFRTYRLFPVTWILNLMQRLLPDAFTRRVFSLPSAEVVAFARKPGDSPRESSGPKAW